MRGSQTPPRRCTTEQVCPPSPSGLIPGPALRETHDLTEGERDPVVSLMCERQRLLSQAPECGADTDTADSLLAHASTAN